MTEDERKKKIAADGETIRCEMQFMDAVQRSVAAVRQPVLHRPGQAVISDAQRGITEARIATERVVLSDRWKRFGPQRQHETWVAKTSPEQLMALRKKKMSERWRGAHFGNVG